MNDNSQIEADFQAFSAPPMDPKAKKEKAGKSKKTKEVTPEQMHAAERLAESVKADKEAQEKSDLIRKLQDYMKLVKEYHPERYEFLKVPKNFGIKNSCEELRVYIADVKAELGKKSGLETVRMLWVEGLRTFEKVNADERFGLRMQGLGRVAENSVLPRQLEDGTIIPGPAIPTLAEFAVEHSNWFQTSVNWRLFLQAAEMITAVHRANSGRVNVQKAAETEIPEETEEMMNEL